MRPRSHLKVAVHQCGEAVVRPGRHLLRREAGPPIQPLAEPQHARVVVKERRLGCAELGDEVIPVGSQPLELRRRADLKSIHSAVPLQPLARAAQRGRVLPPRRMQGRHRTQRLPRLPLAHRRGLHQPHRALEEEQRAGGILHLRARFVARHVVQGRVPENGVQPVVAQTKAWQSDAHLRQTLSELPVGRKLLVEARLRPRIRERAPPVRPGPLCHWRMPRCDLLDKDS